MLEQHIALSSPLSPGDVGGRLRAVTRAEAPLSDLFNGKFRRLAGSSTFVGDIGADGFALRRDIRYRNAFLPRIHGAVHATPEGSRIELRFVPHPLVFAFTAVWMMIAASALVGLCVWRFTAPAGAPLWPLAVPAGMVCLAVALPLMAYLPEKRFAMDRFCTLFDATAMPGDSATAQKR
jgi:hypothetical protein